MQTMCSRLKMQMSQRHWMSILPQLGKGDLPTTNDLEARDIGYWLFMIARIMCGAIFWEKKWACSCSEWDD